MTGKPKPTWLAVAERSEAMQRRIFAEQLRAALKARGIPIIRLARTLGVSQSTSDGWVSRRRPVIPPAPMLIRICVAIRVDPAELLGLPQTERSAPLSDEEGASPATWIEPEPKTWRTTKLRAGTNLDLSSWKDRVRVKRSCDMSFGDLAERLLETKKHEGSKSIREYESRLRLPTSRRRGGALKGGVLRVEFGSMLARDITTEIVRAFIEACVQAGYAPNTVRTLFSILSQVLDLGVELGAVEANPCRNLPARTLPRKAPRDPGKTGREVLADDEVRALLEVETEPESRLLWIILAFTGARIGEASALKWMDLRTAKPLDELRIERSYDCRAGPLHRWKPPKAGAPRSVPVHPRLAAELERARSWQREILGRDVEPEDLLSPSINAKTGAVAPWHQNKALKLFRRDLVKVGLPMTEKGGRSLHSMRHTFCSALVAGGASERTSRTFTHAAADRSAYSGYVHQRWDRACAELLKLPYP